MTNNVGVTTRQGRPTYLNNSAIGGITGGIGKMFGQGNMERMLGGASPTAPNAANALQQRLAAMPSANPQALMKAIQGGMGGLMGGGGTMRTQPVGPAIPVQAPTMSTQPVGRPMPINVRNAGAPMNPTPPQRIGNYTVSSSNNPAIRSRMSGGRGRY